MCNLFWKGTSRQRSGKGAIRKRNPLQKLRWGKKQNKKSGTYTMNTYRKPNEQLFTQLVATELPKLNKKYINIHKAQTAQKVLALRYKTIQTTTEVSPWKSWNSVVRIITDCPDMAVAVDLRCKALKQANGYVLSYTKCRQLQNLSKTHLQESQHN